MAMIELVEALAESPKAKKAAAKKAPAKKARGQEGGDRGQGRGRRTRTSRTSSPGKYEGSAAPIADGSAPAGFDIKGNENSMKYHTTESPWYDQTEAEVWFKTEADAEAAGFAKAGRSDDDDK